MSNDYLSNFIKTFEEVPETSNPPEKAVTKEITTKEEKTIVEGKVTKKPSKVRIRINKSTKEEDNKEEKKSTVKVKEDTNSVSVSPKEKLSIKKSKPTEKPKPIDSTNRNTTVDNTTNEIKSEDKSTYEDNTVETADKIDKQDIGSLSEVIDSMNNAIDSTEEAKRVNNRFNTQKQKNFASNVYDDKVDVKEPQIKNNEVKIDKNKSSEAKVNENRVLTNKDEVKIETKETNNTIDLEIKEDLSPNIQDPNIEKAVQEIDNDIKVERSKEEQEKINAIKREEMLFKKSETPRQFKPKWIALYRQALESDSNTVFSRKIRAGKFRFNDDGINEMLPDMDLTGKSSADLANATWTL